MPTDHDDDSDLFRAAIGEVRPLPARPAPPERPRPRPRARMAERDEEAAREEFRHALEELPLEADDVLSYRQDALPGRAWQRLKRGEISAQEELDLHGLDAATAAGMLREFLADAREHGLGCVRIVHGKGRGSDDVGSRGAPVLKNLVDRMLRQRSGVLAFHSAPRAQGGTGAVLVLLARRRS